MGGSVTRYVYMCRSGSRRGAYGRGYGSGVVTLGFRLCKLFHVEQW